MYVARHQYAAVEPSTQREHWSHTAINKLIKNQAIPAEDIIKKLLSEDGMNEVFEDCRTKRLSLLQTVGRYRKNEQGFLTPVVAAICQVYSAHCPAECEGKHYLATGFGQLKTPPVANSVFFADTDLTLYFAVLGGPILMKNFLGDTALDDATVTKNFSSTHTRAMARKILRFFAQGQSDEAAFIDSGGEFDDIDDREPDQLGSDLHPEASRVTISANSSLKGSSQSSRGSSRCPTPGASDEKFQADVTTPEADLATSNNGSPSVPAVSVTEASVSKIPQRSPLFNTATKERLSPSPAASPLPASQKATKIQKRPGPWFHRRKPCGSIFGGVLPAAQRWTPRHWRRAVDAILLTPEREEINKRLLDLLTVLREEGKKTDFSQQFAQVEKLLNPWMLRHIFDTDQASTPNESVLSRGTFHNETCKFISQYCDNKGTMRRVWPEQVTESDFVEDADDWTPMHWTVIELLSRQTIAVEEEIEYGKEKRKKLIELHTLGSPLGTMDSLRVESNDDLANNITSSSFEEAGPIRRSADCWKKLFDIAEAEGSVPDAVERLCSLPIDQILQDPLSLAAHWRWDVGPALSVSQTGCTLSYELTITKEWGTARDWIRSNGSKDEFRGTARRNFMDERAYFLDSIRIHSSTGNNISDIVYTGSESTRKATAAAVADARRDPNSWDVRIADVLSVDWVEISLTCIRPPEDAEKLVFCRSETPDSLENSIGSNRSRGGYRGFDNKRVFYCFARTFQLTLHCPVDEKHRGGEERSRLIRYLQKYLPDHLPYCDEIIENFKGNYLELFRRLKEKFVEEPEPPQLTPLLLELEESQRLVCDVVISVLTSWGPSDVDVKMSQTKAPSRGRSYSMAQLYDQNKGGLDIQRKNNLRLHFRRSGITLHTATATGYNHRGAIDLFSRPSASPQIVEWLQGPGRLNTSEPFMSMPVARQQPLLQDLGKSLGTNKTTLSSTVDEWNKEAEKYRNFIRLSDKRLLDRFQKAPNSACALRVNNIDARSLLGSERIVALGAVDYADFIRLYPRRRRTLFHWIAKAGVKELLDPALDKLLALSYSDSPPSPKVPESPLLFEENTETTALHRVLGIPDLSFETPLTALVRAASDEDELLLHDPDDLVMMPEHSEKSQIERSKARYAYIDIFEKLHTYKFTTFVRRIVDEDVGFPVIRSNSLAYNLLVKTSVEAVWEFILVAAGPSQSKRKAHLVSGKSVDGSKRAVSHAAALSALQHNPMLSALVAAAKFDDMHRTKDLATRVFPVWSKLTGDEVTKRTKDNPYQLTVDSQISPGVFALGEAAFAGNLSIVKVLILELGSQPTTAHGAALWMAARGKHLDTVGKFLLENANFVPYVCFSTAHPESAIVLKQQFSCPYIVPPLDEAEFYDSYNLYNGDYAEYVLQEHQAWFVHGQTDSHQFLSLLLDSDSVNFGNLITSHHGKPKPGILRSFAHFPFLKKRSGELFTILCYIYYYPIIGSSVVPPRDWCNLPKVVSIGTVQIHREEDAAKLQYPFHFLLERSVTALPADIGFWLEKERGIKMRDLLKLHLLRMSLIPDEKQPEVGQMSFYPLLQNTDASTGDIQHWILHGEKGHRRKDENSLMNTHLTSVFKVSPDASRLLLLEDNVGAQYRFVLPKKEDSVEGDVYCGKVSAVGRVTLNRNKYNAGIDPAAKFFAFVYPGQLVKQNGKLVEDHSPKKVMIGGDEPVGLGSDKHSISGSWKAESRPRGQTMFRASSPPFSAIMSGEKKLKFTVSGGESVHGDSTSPALRGRQRGRSVAAAPVTGTLVKSQSAVYANRNNPLLEPELSPEEQLVRGGGYVYWTSKGKICQISPAMQANTDKPAHLVFQGPFPIRNTTFETSGIKELPWQPVTTESFRRDLNLDKFVWLAPRTGKDLHLESNLPNGGFAYQFYDGGNLHSAYFVLQASACSQMTKDQERYMSTARRVALHLSQAHSTTSPTLPADQIRFDFQRRMLCGIPSPNDAHLFTRIHSWGLTFSTPLELAVRMHAVPVVDAMLNGPNNGLRSSWRNVRIPSRFESEGSKALRDHFSRFQFECHHDLWIEPEPEDITPGTPGLVVGSARYAENERIKLQEQEYDLNRTQPYNSPSLISASMKESKQDSGGVFDAQFLRATSILREAIRLTQRSPLDFTYRPPTDGPLSICYLLCPLNVPVPRPQVTEVLKGLKPQVKQLTFVYVDKFKRNNTLRLASYEYLSRGTSNPIGINAPPTAQLFAYILPNVHVMPFGGFALLTEQKIVITLYAIMPSSHWFKEFHDKQVESSRDVQKLAKQLRRLDGPLPTDAASTTSKQKRLPAFQAPVEPQAEPANVMEKQHTMVEAEEASSHDAEEGSSRESSGVATEEHDYADYEALNEQEVISEDSVLPKSATEHVRAMQRWINPSGVLRITGPHPAPPELINHARALMSSSEHGKDSLWRKICKDSEPPLIVEPRDPLDGYYYNEVCWIPCGIHLGNTAQPGWPALPYGGFAVRHCGRCLRGELNPEEEDSGHDHVWEYHLYAICEHPNPWDPWVVNPADSTTWQLGTEASTNADVVNPRIEIVRLLIEASIKDQRLSQMDSRIWEHTTLPHKYDRFGLFTVSVDRDATVGRHPDPTALCLLWQFQLHSLVAEFDLLSKTPYVHRDMRLYEMMKYNPENRLLLIQPRDLMRASGYRIFLAEDWGLSPLHWACLAGDVDFLKRLCSPPFSFDHIWNSRKKQALVLRSSRFDLGPLHYAVYVGANSSVTLLLCPKATIGADCLLPDAKRQLHVSYAPPPLIIASYFGHAQVVKILLGYWGRPTAKWSSALSAQDTIFLEEMEWWNDDPTAEWKDHETEEDVGAAARGIPGTVPAVDDIAPPEGDASGEKNVDDDGIAGVIADRKVMQLDSYEVATARLFALEAFFTYDANGVIDVSRSREIVTLLEQEVPVKKKLYRVALRKLVAEMLVPFLIVIFGTLYFVLLHANDQGEASDNSPFWAHRAVQQAFYPENLDLNRGDGVNRQGAIDILETFGMAIQQPPPELAILGGVLVGKFVGAVVPCFGNLSSATLAAIVGANKDVNYSSVNSNLPASDQQCYGGSVFQAPEDPTYRWNWTDSLPEDQYYAVPMSTRHYYFKEGHWTHVTPHGLRNSTMRSVAAGDFFNASALEAFLDPATRGVAILLNTIIPSADRLVTFIFFVEFLATGSCLVSYEVFPLRPTFFGYFSASQEAWRNPNLAAMGASLDPDHTDHHDPYLNWLVSRQDLARVVIQLFGLVTVGYLLIKFMLHVYWGIRYAPAMKSQDFGQTHANVAGTHYEAHKVSIYDRFTSAILNEIQLGFFPLVLASFLIIFIDMHVRLQNSYAKLSPLIPQAMIDQSYLPMYETGLALRRVQTIGAGLLAISGFGLTVGLRFVPKLGPTAYAILRTLTSQTVSMFFFIFATYLLAITTAMYTLFSGNLWEFRTFASSIFFSFLKMTNSELGENFLDTDFLIANPTGTPLMLLIVSVFVQLTFLNILIAVVSTEYEEQHKRSMSWWYEQIRNFVRDGTSHRHALLAVGRSKGSVPASVQTFSGIFASRLEFQQYRGYIVPDAQGFTSEAEYRIQIAQQRGNPYLRTPDFGET